MRYELGDEICDALKDRDTWSRRQVTFYKMRHDGLGRLNPPYKGAADLHFPLIDSLIERLKPFWYQQLYGQDQFATFVSLKTQPNDTTASVGAWFDYRLKQKTNFEYKILTTIDAMCMAGRAVIKPYWDYDEKQLCFAAVDLNHFIVPYDIDDLHKDASWCVHIMELSVDQYKKNPYFRQDKDFIDKIKGRNVGDYGIAGTNDLYQTIKRREGITVSTNDNTIVIYEIYRKDGKTVSFDTFSPMLFEEGDEIRPTETLPYDHGKFPFWSFRSEIKDEGWYSPRGVPQIVAAFEDSLCREWNFKHDWMDYFNRPMFKRALGSLGNSANVRFLPGSTLQEGVEPVDSKAPPLSFDQEMQTTRALAEYRINVPDLGATAHLQGRPSARGDVTATQVNAIIGQSGLTDDMRARVFRLDLGGFFKMCWSLYKQFDSQSLTYVLFDEVGQIPPDALQGEYEINPTGSAESWNKPLMLQKAVTRLQMFRGSPYWKQDELEKSVMELDDPRMIKRAFTNPGTTLSEQMERQAEEISIMLIGFPAQVEQADDDVAHLQSMQGYVDRVVQTGHPQPVTPEFATLMLQHGSGHDQAMQQKKNPQLGAMRQMLQPTLLYLQQKAMPPQGMTGMPPNVVAGPGAGAPGMPSPTSNQVPGAGGGKPPDPVKDATSVMNALAALKKSGVPITDAEVNDAMAAAGLPPLQAGTPIPEPITPEPVNIQRPAAQQGGVP